MLRRLLVSFAILAMGLCGFSLQAAIITNPASIIDHTTYITDTTNNLDWLRLDDTRTLGSSFNDVVADASLTAEGWRHASPGEITTLTFEFGSTGNTFSGINDNAGLTLAIAPFIGITDLITNPPEQVITQILGVTNEGGGAHTMFIFENSAGVQDYVGRFSFFSDFQRAPDLSHFLVRDAIAAIPEPESYAMLIAGLGLLGFMARRRK